MYGMYLSIIHHRPAFHSGACRLAGAGLNMGKYLWLLFLVWSEKGTYWGLFLVFMENIIDKSESTY